MNSETIIKYFDNIDQETQIAIYKGTGRPLEVIKKHIIYNIDNDKTLIIMDRYASELHLINIGSIRSIKFNGKRFGTQTWWKTAKQIVYSEDKEKVSI